MKSRKRISALFLAAAMCVSLFGFGITASAEYTDLEEHWSAEAVEKWSAAGVIRGEDGRFRPDDNITRAELAALLDRLLVYSSVGEGQFPDVPAQAWYANAITKLHAAGVMNGDERGAMRPEDFVSREEAAVLMYRALDISRAPEELRFKDAPEVSDWARSAVGSLVSNRYIQGYANEFRPAAYMTRAEVVTLLDRMVALVANKPETYSGSYEGIIVVVSDGVVLENLSAKGLLISSAVGSGTVVLNHADIDGNVTKLNQNTKIQSNNSAITGSQPGGSNGVVSRPMVSGGGGGGGGGTSASNPTMYRVMFKTNGGTFGGANTLFVSVEKGGSLGSRVPSEPTRENFVFTGWYLDEACTQKWEAASAAVQRDMVVYAGWVEQIYYTITFETNGGSAVVSQRIFNGERAQSVTPERRGYRFEGWYVNVDFSGEKYSFDTAVTSSMTLYAKWSSETGQEIVISLADGVTGGSMTANPSAAIAGETVTLTFMPDAGKRLAGKPQVQYNNTQLAEADIIAMPGDTFTFVVPQEVQGVITVVPRFVSVYGIVVQESEHGTTAVDKVQAESGETVTLAVMADEGYEAEEVTVTGGVTVTKVNDTTYTFLMPEKDVTVAVTFKEVAEEVNTLELPLADNSFTQIGPSHVNVAIYTATSTELIFGKDRPSVFLKIDLSQVPANKSIVSASIKMTYKKRNAWNKGVVLLKDNSWTGTSLTYNNSKDIFSEGTELISPADYGTGDSDDLKTCSLDSARIPGLVDAMNRSLRGDKLISLAVHYDNNQGKTKGDATNFYSKDYSVEADRPVVILELADKVSEEYNVTVQESEHGTVTTDKAKAEAGETVTVTVSPGEGYEVDSVTVTGGVTATKVNDTTYSFPMPEGNVTVAVTFKKTAEPEPERYTVSKQAAENGSFETDKTSAQKDETVTITVAPGEGYEVDSVTVTGGVTATKVNDTTYSFPMPEENVTVAVTFKAVLPEIEKTVTLGADRYGYAVNTASGGDDKGYITMITKQNATDFTTFAKNSDIMRMGLLGFDLAKIKEDGGTIQSAKLILTPRNLKNANTIFVHSFDKHNWGPVTNGKQVFELYATGGVFTIPEKFAVMDNLVKDKATALDITAICQEHTGEKISFLFTADTSATANTELQWYSPLASAVAEEKRPQLVVTYMTTKPDAMYDITVQECENGIATVDKTQAKEDETVTITAIPNEGYEVDSVTVSKAEGTVAVKQNSDGAYTFVMPAENVTVAVAFKKTAEPVETEILELPLADNSFTQIGSSHVNVAKYTATSVALILGKDRPSIYLKVDLSQIPEGKQIVSASVKMTYKKYGQWNKGVVLLKNNSWAGMEVTYNNSKDMFSEGTSLVSPEEYGTGDSEDTKTFSLDSARIPGLVDAMNQALTGDKLISLAVHYDNNLGQSSNGACDIWSKDCTEEASCPVVILEIADK